MNSLLPNTRSFPASFYWGTATAAYQIEGAASEDGKGPSIWDTYAHIPGKIKNGHTGDVACDHYHRFAEDIQLMQELGVNSYRFSISWSRIFPEGTGKPNQQGIDFYSRLVDALLAAGIEPFITLYHWDLPQALQDRHGGWQSRETAKAFGEYAGYVAARLSDRVSNFFTLNELCCIVDLGYQSRTLMVNGEEKTAEMAPGLSLDSEEIREVRHIALLAHGLGMQAIRAHGNQNTRCGPAENMKTAVPLIATPSHIEAARTATRHMNAGFLTAIMEGAYTSQYLSEGDNSPHIEDGDLDIISTPVDFLGLNLYCPAAYIRAQGSESNFDYIPFNATHPRMLSYWHKVGPEVLYWGPHHAQALWNVPEIYITESGCGASQLKKGDMVCDTDRVMYIRSYLTQLQQATADGLPIKGYFHWSLLDNFEWAEGYNTRFGLVHVDFDSQQRTPKLSAEYYREVIRHNAVL